jgi:hypothetical protein
MCRQLPRLHGRHSGDNSRLPRRGGRVVARMSANREKALTVACRRAGSTRAAGHRPP